MTNIKLFHVDITYSVMMAAKDEKTAERFAKEQLCMITQDEPAYIMCIGQVTKVSPMWRGSLPWGDNPNKQTCERFTGEI